MTKLPKNARIPCFLCGEWSAVKLTKREKPYFVCQECGVQIFVRYKPGIMNLRGLIVDLADENSEFRKVDKSSLEILSLTSKLLKLEKNLDKFAERKSLVEEVFGSDEKDAIEEAINLEKSEIIRTLKKRKSTLRRD